MRVWDFSRYALSSSAAFVLLAGCSGAQSPSGVQGMMPWTSIGDKRLASSSDLVYVSDIEETVYVYSYSSGQLVGKLTGLSEPMGLCSDSSGNVFVANKFANDIVEYAHGGTTPVATLHEHTSEAGAPLGCAVDPLTGTLAVANFGGKTIALFAHGSGAPTYYTAPNIYSAYFCGFDGAGDLFVDGSKTGPSSGFAFAELPRGSSAFMAVRVLHNFEEPRAVQWDGTYMTLADSSRTGSSILRLQIQGQKATVIGKTPLKNSKIIFQSWLFSSRVLATYAERKHRIQHIGNWSYVTGRLTKFADVKDIAYGITLSVAPPRR